MPSFMPDPSKFPTLSQFVDKLLKPMSNGYYDLGQGFLGSFIKTPKGNILYAWQPNSGSAYIYKWDTTSNTWQLAFSITNLVKGAEEPKSVYGLNYVAWQDTGVSSSTVTAVGSDPIGSLIVKLVGPDTINIVQSPSASYTYTAYATGGVQPYSFAFSPKPDSVSGSTATYTATTLANLDVNTIDITVTVTDNNGTQAKATITANIIKNLTVSITGPSSTNVGIAVFYTASVSGGSGDYIYDFYIDGRQFSTLNPERRYIFGRAGTYTVSVTVTDRKTHATGRASMSVEVFPQLTASMTGPYYLVVGSTGTYTTSASGGSGSYSYQFYIDGSPFSTSNPASYTFNTAGHYIIQASVTDLKTGYTAWAVGMGVDVFPPLTVSITGPSDLKVGDTGIYTASASGGSGSYSYQFYMNGSPFYTSNPAMHVFKTAGTYTISVKVTDLKTGDTGTASMSVKVIFTVSITGDNKLNKGATGTYTASVSGGSGSYSYQFYIDGSPFSTSNPASYTFNTTGTHTVSVIVTDRKTGATGTASMSVKVIIPLVISLSGQPSLKVGETGWYYVSADLPPHIIEYKFYLTYPSGQEVLIADQYNITTLSWTFYEAGYYVLKVDAFLSAFDDNYTGGTEGTAYFHITVN
jgi:hypothetical protein